MNRYVCIHGHFYQPPRENPWLEHVELQESAHPYHDWNERITHECYQPNATARILDGEGRIADIANNYERMSFNFGPTLLSWLELHASALYHRIIESDEASRERFSGHGSALAQAYNHMIMPLASPRDRETQVIWGIRDFERRFGRRPEGMWLPETAVSTETLEVLARHGVAFTVLAPHQAAAVRAIGEEEWRELDGASVDPTRAYRCLLPSGASIALFFYDGPVARAVAFEGLLTSGEDLAARLVGAFPQDGEESRLVHIATDGETFGHHHRYGDMALAYALRVIEERGLARITNYGEFLERYPPRFEARIRETTSWSCIHGVERWRSDCGCATGTRPGWNQAWRAPLRQALDWLRDEAAAAFQAPGDNPFPDPWAARDAYIDVVLDRSEDAVEAFLARHALPGGDQVRALKLMELQRHAMLMFTSCGWFFDDLAGIEGIQILRYAGRVIQLAKRLWGVDLEEGFLSRLQGARSNRPELGDGRALYEREVKPAVVDLTRVGAHYAVRSLFEPFARKSHIYCYEADQEEFETARSGKVRLVLGRVRIASRITGESLPLSFGALLLTDQLMRCGVRPTVSDEAFSATRTELLEVFESGDYSALLRLLDRHFGEATYSLRELFHDQQRSIVHRMLNESLAEIEEAYRRITESYASLIRFHAQLGLQPPRAFKTAAEYILNLDLKRELQKDSPDLARVKAMLQEAAGLHLAWEEATLAFALRTSLERHMRRLCESPADPGHLAVLVHLLDVARALPFPTDLWNVQNLYHDLASGEAPLPDPAAFRDLGRRLNFRVEEE